MLYRTHVTLAGALLALAAALPAAAIEIDTAATAAKQPRQAFVHAPLEVTPSLVPAAERDAAVMAWTAGLQQRHGGQWELRWDERSDRPNLIQGSGIALLPGRGNALGSLAPDLAGSATPGLAVVAARARTFIDSEADLLRSRGLELRLDETRSVHVGDFWSIEFQQYHEGVPVDGAFVFVRIVQGNVVQFGTERVAEVGVSAKPALEREAAFQRAWSELGFDGRVAERREPGELRLYPVLPGGAIAGERHAGLRGAGYAHQLAWRYVFRLAGEQGEWQLLVDAQTQRVLDLQSLTLNVAASVSGGIYPSTNLEPEVVMPFAFTAVTNGGAKVTDALGIYDYSGGSASTALDGKYFKMADNCGAISLTAGADGNLNLGSSGGTDCTTPGIGGAGNTHASRTGFYHLTRINQKARGILTSNTWLQSKVTANMNVAQTCNANWDGSAMNFFKSGPHPSQPSILCGNTGELAAVFLHEWGHALDQNTGGQANEKGSGEAVGDTFAFLETRDSCIGPGFYRQAGGLCYNCTSCSGVRDLADFSLEAPAAKLAKPSNIGSDSGLNCDRLACPYLINGISPYQGPMGYEGHCESYIAGSANWDLKNALVATFGSAGWGKMDAIWYKSLTPSKSAYQLVSGGKCNTAATVDGCGATNWYTVYLAADDDDGNLANGTPNACRIWDSFSAHGIACGTRPACTGGAAPDFSLGLATASQSACAGGSAAYSVQLGASGGFAAPVTLALSGQPAGVTAQFTPNPAAPGTTAALNLSLGGGVAAGSHALTLSGSASGSPGHSTAATLVVGAAVTAPPALSAPANGASGSALTPVLSWQAVSGAAGYRVQVATDVAFSTLIADADNITATQWTAPVLQPATTYYWRVAAKGACGAAQQSAAFSFTTAAAPQAICRNTSRAIPDNDATGVSDSQTVASSGSLTGLKLSLDLSHTYVGDLNVVLSKGATSVMLVQRPGNAANSGGSGCSGNNADIVLDDTASLSAESDCGNDPNPGYVADGSYRPNNPLAAFNGAELAGEWTLRVVDAAANDSGTLNGWCLLPSVPAGPVDRIFADGFQTAGVQVRLKDYTPPTSRH